MKRTSQVANFCYLFGGVIFVCNGNQKKKQKTSDWPSLLASTPDPNRDANCNQNPNPKTDSKTDSRPNPNPPPTIHNNPEMTMVFEFLPVMV